MQAKESLKIRALSSGWLVTLMVVGGADLLRRGRLRLSLLLPLLWILAGGGYCGCYGWVHFHLVVVSVRTIGN